MRKFLPIIIIAGLLAVALLFLKEQGRNVRRPAGPVVAVSFLTAGLGNGVVLKMPDGRALVVDPGSPTTTSRLIRYLQDSDIASIDVLITRSDANTFETLRRLFDAFEVRRVVHTGQPWVESLKGPGGRVAEVLLFAGDSIRLAAGLRLTALSPARTAGRGGSEVLVSVLQYGRTRFLLMSDASVEVEGFLIRSGVDLSSDVLVTGRNGRFGSVSLELIVAARPKYFVVLAARGRGRPSRPLLERIDTKNTGAKVYRTDTDGIVTMVTDGRSVVVEPR
ncbi:MAG: hypothetical protein QHI38_03490 [Armatimonadota bacterium]|nr:hypothetical protein [Armatimonadota bacterium]